MRSLMLLACISAAWSPKSLPVAAQLPPPPQGIAIHVGGDFKRMTREECARKAVEAMGVKEKFIFAEIDKDGNAWGYNEQVVSRTVVLPNKDGAQVIVFTAGKDKQEAQRLCDSIRNHIFTATLSPNTPKQIRSEDVSRKPCGLFMRWSLEQRSAIPVVRHFVPAASIIMEKQGLGTTTGGNNFVFGSDANNTTVAFGYPGPNPINVQFGMVAVSVDEKEAERLNHVILSGIVKVLFE